MSNDDIELMICNRLGKILGGKGVPNSSHTIPSKNLLGCHLDFFIKPFVDHRRLNNWILDSVDKVSPALSDALDIGYVEIISANVVFNKTELWNVFLKDLKP